MQTHPYTAKPSFPQSAATIRSRTSQPRALTTIRRLPVAQWASTRRGKRKIPRRGASCRALTEQNTTHDPHRLSLFGSGYELIEREDRRWCGGGACRRFPPSPLDVVREQARPVSYGVRFWKKPRVDSVVEKVFDFSCLPIIISTYLYLWYWWRIEKKKKQRVKRLATRQQNY